MSQEKQSTETILVVAKLRQKLLINLRSYASAAWNRLSPGHLLGRLGLALDGLVWLAAAQSTITLAGTTTTTATTTATTTTNNNNYYNYY